MTFTRKLKRRRQNEQDGYYKAIVSAIWTKIATDRKI